MTFRCCLTTRDPAPWKAGVDDAADLSMVMAMHRIRDRLSYQMPIASLILSLKASIQIDNRTKLGGDIQRCLLANAAHRLEALALHIDPAPYRSLRWRLRDALAVFQRRAVAIYVKE